MPNLETFWHRLQKNKFSRAGLSFISKLFQIIGVSRWFFYQKIKKPFKSQLFVISVGNLTLGGSGKTPTVIELSRCLSTCFSTAVISRGYRSKIERFVPSVNCKDSWGAIFSYHCMGDEPFMMAESTGQHVGLYVGRDRVASAQKAQADDYKVILLDDGHQQLKLFKNFKILLIEQDVFDQQLFPLGRLRQPLEQMQYADLILVPAGQKRKLQDKISKYYSGPVEEFLPPFYEFTKWHNNSWIQVDKCPCPKVILVTTVARSYRVKRSLQELGLEIAAHLELADHADINFDHHEWLKTQSIKLGVTVIACTEKDHMKLQPDLLEGMSLICVKQNYQLPVLVKNRLIHAINTFYKN